MNKFFVKILSAFIFDKKKRRLFRESKKYRIRGGGNNMTLFERPYAADINFYGKNNRVIFRKAETRLPLQIDVYGDGNVIEIGENVQIHGNACTLCITASNATFTIGKNTHLHTVDFRMTENESSISIGEDCLFSWGIKCWVTDGHSIIDTKTGKITNYGKFIDIGNHVWVGMDVKIGKNVKIEDGCIIGWGSIVTKSISEKNALAVGIPATIVKRERTWSYPAPNDYTREIS